MILNISMDVMCDECGQTRRVEGFDYFKIRAGLREDGWVSLKDRNFCCMRCAHESMKKEKGYE